MGLALQVGWDQDEGPDNQVFRNLDKALTAAGLQPHKEPSVRGEDIYSCSMWGYSGIHYLRRLAACIALREPFDYASKSEPSDDPVVRRYHKQFKASSGPGLRRGLLSLFGKPAPQELEFQHLMIHSDAEGFYIPQDFRDVIFPDESLKIPGGMIGSSIRLFGECNRLAAWLEIPADLSDDSDALWDAAQKPNLAGQKWERHGIETLTCVHLLNACRTSARSGAAVVFC